MPESAPHFVRDIVRDDVAAGVHDGRVHTRFPPEPNGYLHIGHSKAISVDFDMAREHGGRVNLRFDDTNPVAEDTEFVESIKEDIRWLGYQWDQELYASDWFERLYALAEQLIVKGLAYVDSQPLAAIREQRGAFKVPGQDSPYRARTPDENLDLFRRMRAGELAEGECVLRAKIDMTAPNMNLRDPIMYRILRAPHHRTGTDWVIYPMYDWAHGQCDALEGITHSLCTLEFENHRPLYDWFVEHLDGLSSHPRQIEFARLNLSYTVMSKRKLRALVEEGHVDGWDDPRMPTIVALRRRGFSPEAIRAFNERVGVAKRDGVVDVSLLEHTLRGDLNRTSPRYMGVLDPLEVVIDNLEEGRVECFDAPLFPTEGAETRRVPLTRRLWVERGDFREEAPRKWRRMAPGREVRLRYACLVTVTGVDKDDDGRVIRVHVDWDPASLGGNAPDGRKVKGTLHWVSAEHAVDAEVRLYDRLFRVADPQGGDADFRTHLNPDSREIRAGKIEPALAAVPPETRVQFERLGYFVADRHDHADGRAVFNRTVTLRDSWAAIERRNQQQPKPKKARPTPPPAPTGPEPVKETITFDDFVKLDLRAARVVAAEKVQGARKLLRVMVDLGEDAPRQVFAGISKAYPDPSVLVGKTVIVVANLAPRKMRFGVSEAMILAVGGGTERLAVTDLRGAFLPGDTVT